MNSAASTRAKRIAVIGGGIGGLAVVCELQRLQSKLSTTEFVLFEATNRLGGIVETIRQDGFVVESGPDSWVTEKPWARELAIELGLESEIIPSNDDRRRTLILQHGKLVPMPDGMRMMVPADLDAIATSTLFTEEARQAYLSEPGRAEELKRTAPPATADGDESVATFVRRHFGEEVASKIAGPLLSGVFGGSIERLSVRSVMPAFVKMEREHGSLILALQQRSPPSHASIPRSAIFTTLKSGLGTLIDAMTAILPPATIRLNYPVLSLGREGTHWTVTTAAAVESFDAVVLATPAHITRQLLGPLDPQFQELLIIEASSAIVVALAFAPREAAAMRITQGFGFLAPQDWNAPGQNPANPPLLACTFIDQKFRHRVPTGAVLLRAFYGGEAAPSLLAESDESLTASARQQLASILGPIPEPAFTLVRRWPRSLPQYEVGHEARITKLERLTGTFPGLHLAGNTYHGVGLPDLIRDGRAIAREIMGA